MPSGWDEGPRGGDIQSRLTTTLEEITTTVTMVQMKNGRSMGGRNHFFTKQCVHIYRRDPPDSLTRCAWQKDRRHLRRRTRNIWQWEPSQIIITCSRSSKVVRRNSEYQEPRGRNAQEMIFLATYSQCVPENRGSKTLTEKRSQ
jgi:hypothetical protein